MPHLKINAIVIVDLVSGQCSSCSGVEFYRHWSQTYVSHHQGENHRIY